MFLCSNGSILVNCRTAICAFISIAESFTQRAQNITLLTECSTGVALHSTGVMSGEQRSKPRLPFFSFQRGFPVDSVFESEQSLLSDAALGQQQG
jgi:hypothetical protein